jgi:hypothetical protein
MCLPLRYTPVPDSVILAAQGMGATVTELDAQQQQQGGFTTPFPGAQSVVPGTQSSLKRGWTLFSTQPSHASR